ncbi:MAG TPA: aldo/keto reductase [Candidatus Hydrogenedentes bacterium]|nr:aldo/keto reductase [Candidatus Hydrogenedentota bacterium]HPG69801.1 aldo/keto reductase [Candidatus Hydrogenedentota bacterium]
MERVTLGSSGLSVSPVAFGTWQLSPRFWGEQSKEAALAAMRRAVDVGVNFFDTADAYGDGYAETVLGEALRDLPRDELVVTTKFFNHFNPDASRYPDLSPAYLTERCEASLKRLGIETIDLCLLHFYDQLTPLADVAATLERLRDQGKIRVIGVSNHTVEQLRAQRRFADYSVVQPPYSLVDPAGEGDLLPYCQGENIGVMVYSPMHKGLLTGKYTGTETFDDFRQFHPDFQGERFKLLCAGVQSLRPMAEGYGLTVYQLILAATLMHPAIHVAVCGIKTPDQIAEAAGAMGKTIAREDYFAVRKALSGGGTKVLDAKGTRK